MSRIAAVLVSLQLVACGPSLDGVVGKTFAAASEDTRAVKECTEIGPVEVPPRTSAVGEDTALERTLADLKAAAREAGGNYVRVDGMERTHGRHPYRERVFGTALLCFMGPG